MLFELLVDWRVIRRWRTLAVAVASALVPLLSYLDLPLRAPLGVPFDQFHPDTWECFWQLAVAIPLSRSHFNVPASEMKSLLSMVASTLANEFGWLIVALAGAGVVT